MFLNSMKRIGPLVLAGALASAMVGCSGAPKGDAAHGKELYAQCAACHQMQTNTIGPMHCGLLGRPAGSVAGFEYSEAMAASGLVWDAKTLDEFLTSPIAYVTGTNMGFAGFTNPTDRNDLIAYLIQVNADPAICPQG